MDENYLINVQALGEVYLENNKPKLKDVDKLFINLISDSQIKEGFEISKNDLPKELVNVFKNHDLSNFDLVRIDYEINKEIKELTNIEIIKNK